MKIRSFTCVAMLIAGASTPPAHAQWHSKMEAAVRYASISEYDANGERIVQEKGWLPGIGAEISYEIGGLEGFGNIRMFQSSLEYDGQLQRGRPYQTKTGTRLSNAQIGLRYRFATGSLVTTAVEYDTWRRNIKGNANALGLREHTNSIRLLLGFEQEWHVRADGKLSAGMTLIHSRPEHLKIHFSGALDDVALRTRAATGYAIALQYRPAASQPLTLGAQFDYMKVRASRPYPVTRNGAPAGQVTQPEHLRQGITLFVRHEF